MPPQLLSCLALMGHGDEIVVADSNYPAQAAASHRVEKTVIQLPGLDVPQTIGLICSVMPLDYFTDYAVLRMEVDNNPDELTESHQAAWAVLEKVKPVEANLGGYPRITTVARK